MNEYDCCLLLVGGERGNFTERSGARDETYDDERQDRFDFKNLALRYFRTADLVLEKLNILRNLESIGDFSEGLILFTEETRTMSGRGLAFLSFLALVCIRKLEAFRGLIPLCRRRSFGYNDAKSAVLRAKQQKSTNSGDFTEIGSSLITLLNLAQEISSSNNMRFRQAADRLRNQFARSFALRYDLDKAQQFLSASLASIDGDEKLTKEQAALRDTVLLQLRAVERSASSIVFFNEPLPNLDEYKYPFSFPYDALGSLPVTDEEARLNIGEDPAIEKVHSLI
jgi:hypothetical protein